MDASKGTESKKKVVEEVHVQAVEYRYLPGENQEPQKEDVQIIHQILSDENSGVGDSKSLAGAAAVVGHKLQSAKETVSGNKTHMNENVA